MSQRNAQSPITRSQLRENAILEQFVDALLLVEDQLSASDTTAEFDELLRASCKRQREWGDTRQQRQAELAECCH